MCGICGIVNSQNSSDPGLIRNMIGALHHRGPDESGFCRSGKAVLGHSRLSIIDLQSGQQPLTVRGSDHWISYNGEIYNYLELRKELQEQGVDFVTHSDTEVVLQAFLTWGIDSFKRFNGQFAVAVWNNREQKLTLARDRFGIRPLYYYIDKKRILFSSEIKSLFQDPTVPREFNISGLSDTFNYWGPVSPNTVFEKIHEVPPGCFAEYKDDSICFKPYWELKFPKKGDETLQDFDEAVALFKTKLEHSVALRFNRADVPVASYLSGGIDSTVIATLVSRITPKKLDTFSLRFADKNFDEGSFQQAVADKIGSNHNEIEVSSNDIGSVFSDVVQFTERPVLRTAPAPMFLLSGLVRKQGYKVVVTGEGADEILGGYDIFREILVREFLSRNRESRIRQDLLKSLYPWMVNGPGSFSGLGSKFFLKDYDPLDPAVSHRPRWNNGKQVTQLLEPDLQSQLSRGASIPNISQQLPDGFMQWDSVAKAQWWEIKTLLSGYLLSAQGDRMLMGNSIEGRFPFLDPELSEFCFKLPSRFKVMGLNEKVLLKQAYRTEIPEMVLNRPKQPYRSPDAAAFSNLYQFEWTQDLLSEDNLKSSGIFKPKAVQLLLKKIVNRGDSDFSNGDNMRICAVLSTLILQQKFIRETPFSDTKRQIAPIDQSAYTDQVSII